MALIKDAALFSINTDDGEKEMICDIVEIHERPVKKSSFHNIDVDTRQGKKNGKRRSSYRPTHYRKETKVKIFLLDMPARPMVSFRSTF